MLLAEAAATIHLFARPHIVSWLFVLLWFVALENWERLGSVGRKRARKPAAMVALVLSGLDVALGESAWRMAFRISAARDLHLGCIRRGFARTDAFAAIRAWHRARAMAWAFVVSAVATLVNPYGWRLHAHIYRYLGDRYLMNRIDEFRSPDFHGWAQRCFAIILLLVLVAFAGNRLSENRVRTIGASCGSANFWSCCWRCMRDFIRRAIFRFLRCCWC